MGNAETKFKLIPLWEQTEPITLKPQQTHTIRLPSSIESAAKAFYFTQNILKNKASEYQYNIKSSINCKISYKNEKLKNENFMVMFNRDTDEDNGYFENTSILELQGNDILSIEISIKNNSDTDNLTLTGLSLYESDDVKVTTIAKVLKEETISADLIQVTSVFTDALFTQILQTNSMSLSARLAKPDDIVNYIQIENYTMGCYSAILSSEQEQFTITTTVAGTEKIYVYWYSQITGEDAYKYLTTIDPRQKYPDISDSNRDAFKFMVLKPKTVSKKLSLEFAKDENGADTPTFIFGIGTDPTGTTTKGKGFIYKNSNGFYHIYCQSNGTNVGIVMDEQGVHIDGWADQHCESILFKDNGVKLKFVGEDMHSFEYVYNDKSLLTGILQDASYMTSIGYEAGIL